MMSSARDIADVNAVDIKFGYRGKLDVPALDQLAHPRDRKSPVVGLLLESEDAEAGLARDAKQDSMIVQKVAGQIPELRRWLPEHHREEYESGAQLLGDERLVLVGESRPLLLEQVDANLQMARLVAADFGEDVAEDGMRRRIRHPVEQRR